MKLDGRPLEQNLQLVRLTNSHSDIREYSLPFVYTSMPERAELEEAFGQVMSSSNEFSIRYFEYKCKKIGRIYNIEQTRMMALVILRFFAGSKISLLAGFYIAYNEEQKKETIIQVIYNVFIYLKKKSKENILYLPYVQDFGLLTESEDSTKAIIKNIYADNISLEFRKFMDDKSIQNAIRCRHLLNTDDDLELFANVIEKSFDLLYFELRQLVYSRQMYTDIYNNIITCLEKALLIIKHKGQYPVKVEELLTCIKLRRELNQQYEVT